MAIIDRILENRSVERIKAKFSIYFIKKTNPILYTI